MKPLQKIRTAQAMYKKHGTLYLVRAAMEKMLPEAAFDRIAKSITSYLGQQDHVQEVYQQLVKGVYYIIGMGVKGDIAEFGTMTGRSAVALAVSLDTLSKALGYSDMAHGFGKRKLWLFDSFEGLPEARFDVDKNSPHVASGVWGTHTCKGLTQVELSALISKYLPLDSFNILEGWFKDTVPTIPPETQFALIHIDGDLYESAIDVLDHLFAKGMVSKGASLYFDDWDCNAADPKMGERRAFAEVVGRYQIVFSDAGSYGMSCHRFIIHDYTRLQT